MHRTDLVDRAGLRDDVPDFGPGDNLKVHVRVVEGNRERTQVFQGAVIRRQGTGARETFTVRDGTSPTCVELELDDAWVWDMYRPARFVPEVRVVTFRDVNIERLPEQEL